MDGEVPETMYPELLAFVIFRRTLRNPYLSGQKLARTMCDCADYEFEEMALETEEKEPQAITVPVQLVRAKKK